MISEIELGARLLSNPILGVTGTNGKTTTTALLGAMFDAAGMPAEVAGNIGRPLTSLVGAVGPDAWIVCELSSFQLEDVETLRPRIAVLLNLEPDHLDRHGSFEAYSDAKLRIFENQEPTDVAVVPRGFGPIPGRGAPDRVRRGDDPLPAEPRIPGAHNRENAAAATVAARAAGLPDEAIASAAHVPRCRAPDRGARDDRRRALRQRLEGDERRRGAARARVVPGRASARDPRRPRQERELRAARRGLRPGDRAYLIGEAADEIAAALEACGVSVRGRRRPRDSGRRGSGGGCPDGDVVLLSPACASFDQFTSYEERGEEFGKLVQKLQG